VLRGFQKSGIKPDWMVMEVPAGAAAELRRVCPWTAAFRTSDPERPLSPRHQPQQPAEAAARAEGAEIIVRNEKRMIRRRWIRSWTTAAAARR